MDTKLSNSNFIFDDNFNVTKLLEQSKNIPSKEKTEEGRKIIADFFNKNISKN